MIYTLPILCCFIFNDTATTEIYTLSLHDALPICYTASVSFDQRLAEHDIRGSLAHARMRSEEHTSELQSRQSLVCRLLLEKKNSRPSSTSTSCRVVRPMSRSTSPASIPESDRLNVMSSRRICVPRGMTFCFNDTATTEIYTLSLHDALPISGVRGHMGLGLEGQGAHVVHEEGDTLLGRSEERRVGKECRSRWSPYD